VDVSVLDSCVSPEDSHESGRKTCRLAGDLGVAEPGYINHLPIHAPFSRREGSVFSLHSSSMKSLPWRFPFRAQWARAGGAEVAPSPAPLAREWPSPVLAWVGHEKTIALRGFEWQADADHLCAWQRETYAINFPDFKLSLEFAQAFRSDLRRAFLDTNHALWMLDDPATGPCGFIWVVLCTNSWTNERYGYVNNLFIEGAKRGGHLGEELLSHAGTWFKARRVERLRLTVTASNESAVRLYERAGFSVERLEMEKKL